MLKHGRGRSYDEICRRHGEIPFNIKRKAENFFEEGDVSEITTLIYIDDDFLGNCADIIKHVANIIENDRPGLVL